MKRRRKIATATADGEASTICDPFAGTGNTNVPPHSKDPPARVPKRPDWVGRVVANPPYHGAMRSRGPKPYAIELQERLYTISGGALRSQPEWYPVTSEEREPYLGLRRDMALLYSPRIDLAVGPFATEYARADEFDRMLDRHRELVERLLAVHRSNAEAFPDHYSLPHFDGLRDANLNPRCFMAIEVENGNRDMKYLLGSALQAAAWGKIGVVVCWNSARLRSVMGIREMLSLLNENGKNAPRTDNLLVLGKDQMDVALGDTTYGR